MAQGTQSSWWRNADGTMTDGGSVIVACTGIALLFAIIIVSITTRFFAPVDHLLKAIFHW